MATKLTEITTQYNTFVDDQVLTKDQLNSFINYFEDQDRLSRILLSGVGIVCGFNLKFNASKPSITITQGAGVTTDGDLINLRKNIPESLLKSIDLDKMEFSWVKKFEDSFANYRFFKRLETVDGSVQEVPIEMWEILPENIEGSNALSTVVDLQNKVVLLYLESYPKEGDLCTAIDCDNQGIEQVARLRVLLVSKNDADFILSLDSIFSKHNVVNAYFDLPDVAVRRVVLNQLNTSNYNELKRAYHLALNSDGLMTNLTNGISKIIKNFGTLLQLNISNSNLSLYLGTLKGITNFNAYNVPFNVQYRYDCVKDVVDTYNEIKTLLLSLKEECCPDINAFPKHLMLGSLDEIQEEVHNYRHSFYKSPILNGEKDLIQQCRSLVFRLFQLVLRFQTTAGDIKITPSNKLSDLGYRAIPFYYNIQKEFLKQWNAEKTEKYKANTNLSYHSDLLSTSPQVQEPLAFNIDRFDFFRIEGHQGKDYKVALEEIEELKVKYGLAFDVKALSVNINTETLNIDDYECEFEDLNVLLRAWTAEQDCVLGEVSEFFSGFRTDEPGKNIRENLIGAKRVSSLNLLTDSNKVDDDTFTLINKNVNVGIVSKATSDFTVSSTKSSEIVSDHLIVDENALGSVMKRALVETKGGSVNDIIARADNLVAEKISDEVWAEQPELKEFVIDRSIELMAYAHIVAQKMPSILTNIDVVKVDEYKLTLKELCSRVEKMKARYQNIQLSSALKALMGVLITQLSAICCSAKKLEVLLEEINKRKEKIIVRLKLSKFVEKYPGLEHKAGVEPGGTFFLIYLNKTKLNTGRNVLTNVSAAREISVVREVANVNPVNRLSLLGAENVNPKELLTEKALSEKELLANTRITEILNRAARITDLPNNTVVADFALPYMCCSDCAPVNFIVERKPVSLRLEKDHFCLGQDTSPLLFDVSPADGVIKADQEVEGMSIDGTKLVFDENAFPDEMIGKTIHFTVNDQITPCEITVYRAIEFDFEVPESPTSQTEITFKPTGNLDGASFLWSFGDDNLSTDRNPTHKYTLPVNDENKVTVSLTVTAENGICQSTVEHEIIFAEVDVQIALPEDSFCENDEKNYPFEITPAGAEAKIEGQGVTQISAGSFVFVPANAESGEIEFLLNGKLSGLKVTVNKAPVASFKPEQVGNELVLTNNSTGASSFVWNVNGEKIERSDTSPVSIELTENTPTSWRLALQAISETCGSNMTDFITFQTELINTCTEDAKIAMQKDLEVLQTQNLPGSNLVVPIWMSTSKIYGGTDKFKEGVLNDIDNYLAGKNNEKLRSQFLELLQQTASMVIEMSGNRDGEEFPKLLRLFELQLKLFYNILGCQNADVIDASADQLAELFKLILTLLRGLREREIFFSDELKEFIKIWGEKIKGRAILEEHFKVIMEENLI
ncbi:PKD domain-containing protein [Maribellus maritimus]|uniref:PKD domain-containing protein n=1 Tax=Maribellus maritimus TaxID=2870838 RepID=UPI001EEA0B2F|nr:PKD domain-containing protein [Maribellus maritimus]MCG6187828.1 hypothetical protein [Maribellus maritimus]